KRDSHRRAWWAWSEYRRSPSSHRGTERTRNQEAGCWGRRSGRWGQLERGDSSLCFLLVGWIRRLGLASLLALAVSLHKRFPQLLTEELRHDVEDWFRARQRLAQQLRPL